MRSNNKYLIGLLYNLNEVCAWKVPRILPGAQCAGCRGYQARLWIVSALPPWMQWFFTHKLSCPDGQGEGGREAVLTEGVAWAGMERMCLSSMAEGEGAGKIGMLWKQSFKWKRDTGRFAFLNVASSCKGWIRGDNRGIRKTRTQSTVNICIASGLADKQQDGMQLPTQGGGQTWQHLTVVWAGWRERRRGAYVSSKVTKQMDQPLTQIRPSEGKPSFRGGAENEEIYQQT